MRDERRVGRAVAEVSAATVAVAAADRDRGGVRGRRNIDAGGAVDGAKLAFC